MRSNFASGGGLALAKTPNYRRQAARRRLLVACIVLGLALASSLIGAMVAPGGDVLATATTGPFSYFPHQ